MALFPMFVKLQGRRCLVVGAGKIAAGKIASLLLAGADVLVVAPRATRRIAAWSRAGRIRWHRRKFAPRDLRGARLVVSATGSSDVNERVIREARRLRVLCNAVDDPAHCDFYYPAVVRRGLFQIAISTSGASPSLAHRLRRELERTFSSDFGDWVSELGSIRKATAAQNLSSARRRRLFRYLSSSAQFESFLKNRGAAGVTES